MRTYILEINGKERTVKKFTCRKEAIRSLKKNLLIKNADYGIYELRGSKLNNPAFKERTVRYPFNPKEKRIEKGWSQLKLSTRSGIGLGTIQQIEYGLKVPTLEETIRLKEVLNAPKVILRWQGFTQISGEYQSIKKKIA